MPESPARASKIASLKPPQSARLHASGGYNKDYSILGSILGSPHFGKLPLGFCMGGSELWGFEAYFGFGVM